MAFSFWKNRRNKKNIVQSRKVADELKNACHIGDQLWSIIKSSQQEANQSPLDEDFLEDCVELVCTRKAKDQENPPRKFVHRCVLKTYSPYFREQLRTHKNAKSLRVDVMLSTLDQILEYIYTGKPLGLYGSNCVQVYAIATKFCLDEIAKEVKNFIQTNIKGLLEDPDFLLKDCLADVQSLADVFKELASEGEIQLRLVRKLHQWYSSIERVPTDLEENRSFSVLIGKVLAVKRSEDSLRDDEQKSSQIEADLVPPPTRKLNFKERLKKTLTGRKL